MNAKCFECGKRVSSVKARFVKDENAKYNPEKGTINGERIYGPDCYAKIYGEAK